MQPTLFIPVLLFILGPLTGQHTVDNTGWKSTGFYAEALGGALYWSPNIERPVPLLSWVHIVPAAGFTVFDYYGYNKYIFPLRLHILLGRKSLVADIGVNWLIERDRFISGLHPYDPPYFYWNYWRMPEYGIRWKPGNFFLKTSITPIKTLHLKAILPFEENEWRTRKKVYWPSLSVGYNFNTRKPDPSKSSGSYPPAPMPTHTLYMEAYGVGGYFSVNYEHNIRIPDFAIVAPSVGYSFTRKVDKGYFAEPYMRGSHMVPFRLHFLFPGPHLFIDIGVDYLYELEWYKRKKDSDRVFSQWKKYFFFELGARYYFDGFFIKASAIPVVNFTQDFRFIPFAKPEWENKTFAIWPSVGIGYNFSLKKNKLDE